MVWTVQIMSSLLWIIEFLTNSQSMLVRRFDLDSYLQIGPRILMTLDASPWGIGGILEIDGVIKSYFAEGIPEEVAQYLDVQVGSSES